MLEAESVLEGFAGLGMLDLDSRDGLISDWLFFRDLVPGARPAPVVVVDVDDAAFAAPLRNVGRLGDDLREDTGEVVREAWVVWLEVWPLLSALRVEDVDESRFREGGCTTFCELLVGSWPSGRPRSVFGGLSIAAAAAESAREG